VHVHLRPSSLQGPSVLSSNYFHPAPFFILFKPDTGIPSSVSSLAHSPIVEGSGCSRHQLSRSEEQKADSQPAYLPQHSHHYSSHKISRKAEERDKYRCKHVPTPQRAEPRWERKRGAGVHSRSSFLGLNQLSGLQPAVLQHHKHNPTRQAQPPTHLPFAALAHSHSFSSPNKVSPPTHHHALCCLLSLSHSFSSYFSFVASRVLSSLSVPHNPSKKVPRWSYWSHWPPSNFPHPFLPLLLSCFPPRSLCAVSCYLVLYPQRLQSWPLQPISSSAHLLLRSSALRKHTHILGTVPSQGCYHRQISFYQDQQHRLSTTKS